MLRLNPRGDFPEVSESAFVDPTAIVCGKVIVGPNVFIGPYAVIRADEMDSNGNIEPIIIGANSNIQDGVVIHSKDGAPVVIGEHSSIAHRSIIHGPCVIGNRVFVGFNTVVYNSVVGDESVLRHNCVVDSHDIPERFYLPSATVVRQATDLNKLDTVPEDARNFSESVMLTNISFAAAYRKIQNTL
ncbi:carbonate dehydratase [Taylorella equigenitalis]|uniref:Carbonic anhydrase, gamma class n=1 Tax=Taylorella equigenitalis (strain MCE9) TaxID=937774 RepID=A0A654KFK9_TAYEM|nr:carbonate dehydratase [Taylorella equigenitalis]ADU91165.1 Carbonic anhydrase, gamma class [Taylorella equigenitalis MCE9]ASY30841.1 carbonate dehydratase [Taylorella equigenitalis]ASY38145.1 carbonate dehydratase [Taylorella equigenitalis]ASY39669.1 carbonate dehydratase [Taylorella equigenitalis]ASY41121.1 carbonate dehydratase [Taylorella equigenitalis]